MKHLIHISGLVILLISYGCVQLEQEKDYSDIVIKENVTNQVTPHDLSGDWTCYKIFKDYRASMLNMDVDYSWLPGEGNLVFKNDSMWYFDYPMEFRASNLFKLDSNNILITNNGEYILELNGDSLVWTRKTQNDIIFTEYYVRDTLEEETIQLLLRDSVNIAELIGSWVLETSLSTREGDIIELDFPFELPDSLVFNKANIASDQINGRRIKIDIDGTIRDFRFGFTKEEGYTYQKIWLLPTDWYHGEKVIFHYNERIY